MKYKATLTITQKNDGAIVVERTDKFNEIMRWFRSIVGAADYNSVVDFHMELAE